MFKKSKLLFCILIGCSHFSLCSYTASSSITLEWHAFEHANKRFDGTDAGGRGHSFIKVNNNTSNTIKVGYYSLSPNQYVTIGLWTSDAAGGGSGSSSSKNAAIVSDDSNFKQGVLYNEERYKYTKVEQMQDDIYTIMTLSSSQLSDLSDLIKKKNNTYNVFTYNCATFTTEIWNKLNGTSYWAGWFRQPSNNKNCIKNYEYFDGNKSLTYTDSIYFYNENTGVLERL